MEYRIGERQLAAGSRYLTLELRAGNDLLADPAALRHGLAEDGYLLLRGVHDPAEVLAARGDILQRMAKEGLLDSLVNTTDRYRLSCDTRYQRASEPMDDRWAGAAPAGHSAFWQPGAALEPVEVSRRRWRI